MMPLMHAAFAIAVLGVMWSIYRMHKNPAVDFNILDILMEGGKVSKVSCLVMGAFFVTSWVIVDLQAHGHMSEGYLGLYGGMWIAPLITKLWPSPLGTPATITTATAEVVTTTAKADNSPPPARTGRSAR